MKLVTKTLSERLEKMLEMVKHYEARPLMDPARVQDDIDRFIVELATAVAKNDQIRLMLISEPGHGTALGQLRAKIVPFLTVNQTISEISSHYSQAYRSAAELTNLRKTESWINWQDHLRTLLFRALTTLTIAGGVLLTSYIAHRYDIPLPLIRGINT